MITATAEKVAEPAGIDLWLGGTQAGNTLSGGMQAQPAGASNQGVSLNRLEARKGTRKTESRRRLCTSSTNDRAVHWMMLVPPFTHRVSSPILFNRETHFALFSSSTRC